MTGKMLFFIVLNSVLVLARKTITQLFPHTNETTPSWRRSEAVYKIPVLKAIVFRPIKGRW